MSNPDLLDTARGCAHELAEINKEIASFGHEWSKAAGELKLKLKMQERFRKAALRGLIGDKMLKDEKAATCDVAVEKSMPGLAEQIEILEGAVEEHRVLFNTLKERASHAQSVLNLHRDENKISSYVRAA